MKIATKRAVLLHAWRIAQRRIERDGTATLSPEEYAGQQIAHHSSATVAHAMCEPGGFYDEVRAHLEQVVTEEGGAVAPRGGNAS